MRFYTKEDRLFEMICSDYQLLNIISRFGLNLGFEEKTIAEVCDENSIDCNTFLAIIKTFPNFCRYIFSVTDLGNFGYQALRVGTANSKPERDVGSKIRAVDDRARGR